MAPSLPHAQHLGLHAHVTIGLSLDALYLLLGDDGVLAGVLGSHLEVGVLVHSRELVGLVCLQDEQPSLLGPLLETGQALPLAFVEGGGLLLATVVTVPAYELLEDISSCFLTARSASVVWLSGGGR